MFVDYGHGYFETCDRNYMIRADETGTILSPNYPMYGYSTGSSCRYFITAPSGYEISVSCTISIPKNPETAQCIDFFTIATDGNKTITGSEYFCGMGTISKTSKLNYITFGKFNYCLQFKKKIRLLLLLLNV